MFDENQKKILLTLARDAIETYLNAGKHTTSPEEEFLKTPLAAFVTLKIEEELRGCIGTVEASEPLGNTIIQCAVSAAFRDPRFPPLTKQEYPFIDLEISVLSPFQRTTKPEEIIPGVHGLMITWRNYRGLLLPQVATEYEWDTETFLSYTCRKAGLHPEAWKDPETVIETFTAIIFSEK